MSVQTDTLLSTDEIAAAAGITFRQLDHWIRTDLVAPVIEADGSGSRRRWSPGQVPQLTVLGQVARALGKGRRDGSWIGASPRVLHAVAANWADGSLALSEHVTLRWQVPADDPEGSAA